MEGIPFCCPVCGAGMREEPTRAVCGAGHCFDRAAQGYYNLLLPQKKHSALPGDDPQSLKARREFLEGGHYQALSDAVNQAAGQALKGRQSPLVVDCCCGEGYYTHRLFSALAAETAALRMAGFDISKQGVRMAASRKGPVRFAVASIFRIPLQAGAVDLALHAFAPYCDGEITRILKPGGVFVDVIPGRRHLFGLKSVLYHHPYENDEQGCKTEMNLINRVRVGGNLRLFGPSIARLFQMTPYFYRCGQEAAGRLLALPVLETEIDFVLDIYQR